MAISYRTDTVNGVTVLSYFPSYFQLCKGVVYFFHGMGGSANKFASKADELAAKAVSLGLGVVFFSAKGDKWVEADDLSTVKKTRTMFKARGLLGPTVREYAIGHSAGGGIAPHVAHNLGLDAVALYSSAGRFKDTYDRPTIFLPGELDTTATPAAVRKSYDLLNGRGVRTAFEIRTGEGHEFSLIKSDEVFRFFEVAPR